MERSLSEAFGVCEGMRLAIRLRRPVSEAGRQVRTNRTRVPGVRAPLARFRPGRSSREERCQPPKSADPDLSLARSVCSMRSRVGLRLPLGCPHRQASASRIRSAHRLSMLIQEFMQPIRIQRRPTLSKEGQRLPHGLDPHTRFLADDQRALVHRHIGEFARVHQNDLVFGNTFEREDVLECAQIAEPGDLGADLLEEFARHRLLALFTEFDRAPQRTIEGHLFMRVPSFGNEDPLTVADDADGDGTDVTAAARQGRGPFVIWFRTSAHWGCAALMFSAARRTVSSILFLRVSALLALVIQYRITFFDESLNASKFRLAWGFAEKARLKSGGISRRSIASSLVHEPSRFAASILARPAGAIRPSSMSFSTRRLLGFDQTLPGLRGVICSLKRVSSSEFVRLSIQPKDSPSSTPSSYEIPAIPDPFLAMTRVIPADEAWLALNHLRHPALVFGCKVGFS